MLDLEENSPFEANDCGLWCPLCGAHVAAPWNVDDHFVPPDVCPLCGFPDQIDPEAMDNKTVHGLSRSA